MDAKAVNLQLRQIRKCRVGRKRSKNLHACGTYRLQLVENMCCGLIQAVLDNQPQGRRLHRVLTQTFGYAAGKVTVNELRIRHIQGNVLNNLPSGTPLLQLAARLGQLELAELDAEAGRLDH